MNLQRITYSGAAAIAISFSPREATRIIEVRLTLAAVSADLANLAISLDSEKGPSFDTVLAKPDTNEDLAAVTSWRYADLVPPIVFPGDKLLIAWPNTGNVSWGIEIVLEG